MPRPPAPPPLHACTHLPSQLWELVARAAVRNVGVTSADAIAARPPFQALGIPKNRDFFGTDTLRRLSERCVRMQFHLCLCTLVCLTPTPCRMNGSFRSASVAYQVIPKLSGAPLYLPKQTNSACFRSRLRFSQSSHLPMLVTTDTLLAILSRATAPRRGVDSGFPKLLHSTCKIFLPKGQLS